MNVVVETPKGSFRKYRKKGVKYVTDLTSPMPTLFNYGFIEGTLAADGMPQDAIILGGRIAQGSKLDVVWAGTVRFVDDGVADDKAVTSTDGRIRLVDRLMIHLFFSAYTAYKIVRYLVRERRLARCRYLGFSLCRK
ncbi:MAG: inorganic diphosphatase [Candidatus Altiarchaeota archaeon]